jgi:hypothetical protein
MAMIMKVAVFWGPAKEFYSLKTEINVSFGKLAIIRLHGVTSNKTVICTALHCTALGQVFSRYLGFSCQF